MKENILTEKDNDKLNILKGFGVLNKYATKETAEMTFEDMREIAKEKHLAKMK